MNTTMTQNTLTLECIAAATERKKNKQLGAKSKGITLIDFMLSAVGILIVIGIIASIYPKATHMVDMFRLGSDVSDIQKAAKSWKGQRTNYTGISIAELCTSRYLSATICGDSDDATSANPWGGNYTVAANTNTSMIDVAITSIDSDYGQQVIDNLAPRTADECSSAGTNGADCDTIALSGTTATLTLQ